MPRSRIGRLPPETERRFRPVRDALVRKLKNAAVEEGADPEKVDTVLAEMESGRPLLDWLRNGGFESLVKLIMTLVALL